MKTSIIENEIHLLSFKAKSLFLTLLRGTKQSRKYKEEIVSTSLKRHIN